MRIRSRAEIAIERLGRSRAHVDEALSATLAEDAEDLLIEVDIVRLGVVRQVAQL